MKFAITTSLALLASGIAHGAVDYSYCQKQFNTYLMPNKPCKEIMLGMVVACSNVRSDKTDSSYYPFELTADGKIKPHPTLNLKTVDGQEIISSTNKDMDYQSIVSRNEKGEVIEVSTNFTMKNMWTGGGIYGNAPTQSKPSPFVRKNESNVKLEIKNGKCIPSRVDSVNSLGDESRQDVSFDAKLCRDVAQFFKKNPEAASCFDKNLMEKANGIFKDFYKNNKDIYGDVDTEKMLSTPKPLKTKLKSQMNPAGGMYGYPGIGYNGMGMGMGMGMPGATTQQMLTPMMPSIDSVINSAGTSGYPQGFGGFGKSPVVSAMQIMTLCQGGGFGPNVLKDVVDDDSVWKTEEASAAKSQEAKGELK